jgi:hypothetical protein
MEMAKVAAFTFIDAQGYRCHYSDYELKSSETSRLSRFPHGKTMTSAELKKRLSKAEAEEIIV